MFVVVARLVLAAASGAIVYTSYQPLGWWPAAVVGIAMLYVALMPWGSRAKRHHVRWWQGALIAFAHSLVANLLLLPWIGQLVGNMPYVALAISMALYALLLGAAGAAVVRWRWGFLPFAAVYTAVEFVRSSVPFGGFPWLRLAWGQVGGPLANLVAWGGPALVTFATVVVGTAAMTLIRPGKHLRRWAAVGVIAPLALGLAARAGMNDPDHTVGTVKAAAVQGNVPRMGLDFNAQRRAVLANHARMTHELARQEQGVQLVLWPENSSDVNPFADAQARELIDAASDDVGAPIMVGTLTEDEVGERNTMQVFEPGGRVGGHHFKKFLQPFGETMPMRDTLRRFSDYVDLAGDFKPGTGNGVVDMAGIALGVATCYEVSFDQAFRTATASGAQLLVSPTNNATFGFSEMTYQQLAMSRMRAMETDRALVVPATSGVSAIVSPDGTVQQRTKIFEAKYLVADLPLRDSQTLAVRYGAGVQLAIVIMGGVSALCALWLNRLPKSPKSPRSLRSIRSPRTRRASARAAAQKTTTK